LPGDDELCRFTFVSILQRDLAAIGACSWQVSRQIERDFAQGGNRFDGAATGFAPSVQVSVTIVWSVPISDETKTRRSEMAARFVEAIGKRCCNLVVAALS
jgi:hypothetical protein